MLVKRSINGYCYEVDSSKACSVSFNDSLFDAMGQVKEASVDSLIDVFAESVREPRPFSLVWQLTTRCNFACPFCYVRDNLTPKEIGLDHALRIIDELLSCGLVRVTLTGGECLLHPGFSSIYCRLKQAGVFVTVFTNGSLVKGEILDLFKALPPFSAEITFYDTNFSSRPYQAALELRDIGVDVLGKFTVSKDNSSMLDPIERWCSNNSIPFIFDPMLFNGSNGVDAVSQAVEEGEMAKLNARRFGHAYFAEREQYDQVLALRCKASDRSVFITPKGELSLCPDLPKRWDMSNAGFNDAYNSMKKWINGVKDLPIQGCCGCVDQALCMMCAARALPVEGPSGFAFKVPKGHCERIARQGSMIRRELDNVVRPKGTNML